MTSHPIATREEWLAARLELLEAEKALTRRGDEVARQRQNLPWVPVDKQYTFEQDLFINPGEDFPPEPESPLAAAPLTPPNRL